MTINDWLIKFPVRLHAYARHMGITWAELEEEVALGHGSYDGIMSSFNHDLRTEQIREMFVLAFAKSEGNRKKLLAFLNNRNTYEMSFRFTFDSPVGFAKKFGIDHPVPCFEIRGLLRRENGKIECVTIYPHPVDFSSTGEADGQKTDEGLLKSLKELK